MKNTILSLLGLAFLAMTLSSCDQTGKFNLFSVEDDITLGAQLDAEIENTPSEYPILDRSAYPDAYAYLDQMRDEILADDQVIHKDKFVWEMHIIADDSIVNAFATPGGYIYVYTGLIKYLNRKSSLAGVLGHEIAHSDRRHSTQQLTKVYGLSVLFEVVLGNNSEVLQEIALGLSSLSFSRANEAEADEFSVNYLCETEYHADGAADFFEKIVNSGGAQPPQFLSTHPSPDNRVEDIQSYEESLSCGASITATEDSTGYEAFKLMLP